MPGQGQRIHRKAPIACLPGIKAHFALLPHIGQQPQGAASAERFLRFSAQLDGMRIPGGEIVEKHITRTAADHAQVLDVVFGQGEVMAQRGLLPTSGGSL